MSFQPASLSFEEAAAVPVAAVTALQGLRHHGDIEPGQKVLINRALVLSLFVGQKLGTFVSSENHEDLLVLAELIEAGKVTPVIDRTYPLREAAAATSS